MTVTGEASGTLLEAALRSVSAVTGDQAVLADSCAVMIAESGDHLWPVKGKQGAAGPNTVASAVVTGLRLLAGCPGGASFDGQHWCMTAHDGCPGPGKPGQAASAARGTGAVHTPLDLALAVTRPAIDLLVTGRAEDGTPAMRRSGGILSVRVADISCGSGAFLLAAGILLSSALAYAWELEGDPRAGDPLAATREVTASCLYGADLSAAAVALSKLALQLAGYDPARPAVTLDETFTAGDSLLGTDFAAAFPGVFHREQGGFDLVLGNPPFLGGQKITAELGRDYRDRLITETARGRRGSADLAAYFLLRMWDLTRPGGVTAILATNTLAQGDTREVGLEQVCAEGGDIRWAVKSEPWPDSRAALHYCAAVIAKPAGPAA